MNLEEFSKEISHFYENPTQENFDKIEKYISEHPKEFETKDGAKLLTALILARASQKYNLKLQNNSLSKIVDDIKSNRGDFVKFVNSRLINPFKLDVWWASFFATGDSIYLERIFYFVGKDINKERNIKKMLTYGSANWSFISNCRQHKKIRDFAKEQMIYKLPKGKQEALKACLKDENLSTSSTPQK
jgi:hypothetical protein